jgi:hypothetical protein
MNRRQAVADSLAESIARLDTVLKPWGFSFESDGVQSSHRGPYASGHYCRGATRIGLSCRNAIDNIYYEHSFITVHAYCKETERFTIRHDTLMRSLGHSDDCWLVVGDGIPNAIAARDGGDRVEALIHDLQLFASSVLREPCDAFYAIMRRGSRSYSVA